MCLIVFDESSPCLMVWTFQKPIHYYYWIVILLQKDRQDDGTFRGKIELSWATGEERYVVQLCEVVANEMPTNSGNTSQWDYGGTVRWYKHRT